MGFISTAIIATFVGAGAVLLYKDSAEEKKRKNTPCNFDNGLLQSEFNAIVENACNSIKRVTEFSIDGPIVRGTVRSQSGISNWHFTIDFNDYGKITGKYWLSSKNDKSQIPSTIAKQIQNEIKNRIS